MVLCWKLCALQFGKKMDNMFTLIYYERPHFQAPRRELKIQHAVPSRVFLMNTRCLKMRCNTVLSVWYIFSIDVDLLWVRGKVVMRPKFFSPIILRFIRILPDKKKMSIQLLWNWDLYQKQVHTYTEVQITKGNQSTRTVCEQCLYSPVEVDAASECMVDV